MADFDEQKRAEALLAGEKRLLEMVATGCALADVLDALCRIVEDLARPCYCSVYTFDPSGSKFHTAAAPSLPSSFNDPIEGAPVDRETGPCGLAACLKTQVIASDVASEQRWPASAFRPLALAHGLRSCWSTPILSLAGDVLGTFAIYQNEPASPTPLQQDLIARLTHIASIAIERAQGEAALKRTEDALGELRSQLTHIARVTTLGALTGSIAHEVNQPLAGIMTNASTCLRMLADDPPNIEGACETARRTIRDANRASEVIARLRALFGKREPVSETVDLNDAAREVLALLSRELQRGRVELRAELAENLPLVTGDRVQLQQVVLNLLLNAAEAMSGVEDRLRLLAIRTGSDHEGVRLSVQDTGAGFEPENLPRLFEAFYTTKSGGMGIGLSISRSIIVTHRGRLWAELNEGPGATFAFSVPPVPEDGTPAVTDTTAVNKGLE